MAKKLTWNNSALKSQTIPKSEVDKAKSEAGKVVFGTLEEERIASLKRQAARFNITDKDTELENTKRQLYNLANFDLIWDSIYEKLVFAPDFLLIKLFMKPISNHGGVLVPDMIKVQSPSGEGVMFEPNLFPYLNCAVVVNPGYRNPAVVFGTGGIESDSRTLAKGSFVTLTNDFSPAKSAFFLCKLAPDPKTYKGFALIHRRQVESAMSSELVSELGGYSEVFKLFSQQPAIVEPEEGSSNTEAEIK